MPNHHDANPSAQTREPRFPGRGQSKERCPDCDIEDNLNAVGQPAFNKEWAKRKTAGCETCGGTGQVYKAVRHQRQDETRAEWRSRVFPDPYEVDAVEWKRQREAAA